MINDKKLTQLISEAKKSAKKGSIESTLTLLEDLRKYAEQKSINIDHEIFEISHDLYTSGIGNYLEKAKYHFSVHGKTKGFKQLKLAQYCADLANKDISDRILEIEKGYKKH